MTTETKTFKVKVIQVRYALKEIEVEAASLSEAEDLAIDKAYDEHYGPNSVYDHRYLISAD